jgi:hypothetical protein
MVIGLVVRTATGEIATIGADIRIEGISVPNRCRTSQRRAVENSTLLPPMRGSVDGRSP